MKSLIYTGEVMHARVRPANHVLRYPHYFYAFDLDELPLLDKEIKRFGYNRRSMVSLHDRDYLKGDGSIKEKILALLKSHGANKGVTRIILVTQARYLGYVFNPVSFYFCYGKSGAVSCVVAEVNNTFGEKHIYLLDKPVKREKGFIEFRHDKKFHVSPFNNVDGYYTFLFSEPGEKIDVRIILHRAEGDILTARLSGDALPLNSENLRSVIRVFPVTTLLTVARIYKEAFKLFFFRKLGYNPKPEPRSSMTIGRLPATFMQKLSKKGLEKIFSSIESGYLTVTYPDGSVNHFGSPGSKDMADITVNGWSFFSKVLFNGEIGFGESFMEHGWDSSDPVKLILFFIKHLDLDEDNHVALKTIGLIMNRLLNRRKKNTINGSRKNIGEHYDLGNDFFREFLDKRLIYSSGIFRKKTDTLEQSQLNKIHEIIDRAGIGKNDHVLEIGSGWGGFAVEAAKKTGCRVTTITLSKEQHDHVQALIKKERLEKRVNVEIIDYRHMTGSFDKIVSIEMLEAVGHENFASYFRAIDRLLKPEGVAVLQVITTMDHHYKDYKRRIDWIQKHIFPGGHLPSVTALSESMAANSRLYIEALENIGPHYATTLREWRKRFTASSEHLMSLGYDGKFQRKWLYYLYVCEAGFAGRVINDVIITLARPGNNLTQIGFK
ncbi:MAG TPA: DUF1365 family protein [Spirochaetota bacterium]|nr:DUF1365 family protein [Spirochaetota bacterium]